MARDIDGLDEQLRALPLAGELPSAELKALRNAGSQVSHAEGTSIVHEGATGVGFHIILEGTARVESGGKTVAELARGDIFGELSMIDDKPRSASVIAATPVRTFAVPAWAVGPLLDRSPGLSKALLREMSLKLRRTLD